MFIVDPWLYSICCIRSGVILCTLLMVLYLDHICQCRLHGGALVAYLYTYAPPRRRTSQYRRTFISLSMSLWNDLANPVFHRVGLAGFKSRTEIFIIGLSCSILQYYYYFSVSRLSVYMLVLWCWGLLTDTLLKIKAVAPVRSGRLGQRW